LSGWTVETNPGYLTIIDDGAGMNIDGGGGELIEVGGGLYERSGGVSEGSGVD
jgi:hypothetical protein